MLPFVIGIFIFIWKVFEYLFRPKKPNKPHIMLFENVIYSFGYKTYHKMRYMCADGAGWCSQNSERMEDSQFVLERVPGKVGDVFYIKDALSKNDKMYYLSYRGIDGYVGLYPKRKAIPWEFIKDKDGCYKIKNGHRGSRLIGVSGKLQWNCLSTKPISFTLKVANQAGQHGAAAAGLTEEKLPPNTQSSQIFEIAQPQQNVIPSPNFAAPSAPALPVRPVPSAPPDPSAMYEAPAHPLEVPHRVDEIEFLKEQLDTARDELEIGKLCAICMDQQRNTILLPCGHFLYCGHCVETLDECAHCRSKIQMRNVVYT